MTKIEYDGREFNCLEHIGEIKSTGNGHLFERFYNKKQMFAFFVGKYRENISGKRGTRDIPRGYECHYGLASGVSIHSTDWSATIEFFRLADLDAKAFREGFLSPGFEQFHDRIEYDDSFFVKDDAGEAWFVRTSVD